LGFGPAWRPSPPTARLVPAAGAEAESAPGGELGSRRVLAERMTPVDSNATAVPEPASQVERAPDLCVDLVLVEDLLHGAGMLK